jgi:hypothetical protein
MSTRGVYRRIIVAVALAGLVTPTSLLAADQVPTAPSKFKTLDVRLDGQHRLNGLVVDGQGKPQVATKVELQRTDRKEGLSAVVTDAKGRFAFASVKAGTYRLQTTEGVCLCRLWTRQGAPPSAASSLLIVNDARIERGQRPIGELFRSDPFLMAAVVAAAIAIPIAVHKAQDESPTGS